MFWANCLGSDLDDINMLILRWYITVLSYEIRLRKDLFIRVKGKDNSNKLSQPFFLDTEWSKIGTWKNKITQSSFFKFYVILCTHYFILKNISLCPGRVSSKLAKHVRYLICFHVHLSEMERGHIDRKVAAGINVSSNQSILNHSLIFVLNFFWMVYSEYFVFVENAAAWIHQHPNRTVMNYLA